MFFLQESWARKTLHLSATLIEMLPQWFIPKECPTTNELHDFGQVTSSSISSFLEVGLLS